MKPEILTEYFVKYMNFIVSCHNMKNQDPLYVKNNLIHKTWKFQEQLIIFEKEIPEEILADDVLFGSYSLLHELSYEIKDMMLQFLRDSSLDRNFFDDLSSTYSNLLKVIEHYIHWDIISEEKLMKFGFCKVDKEDILLIPYYMFPIIPETFNFLSLHGYAIEKKYIPVSSQELIMGCLSYGIVLKES